LITCICTGRGFIRRWRGRRNNWSSRG